MEMSMADGGAWRHGTAGEQRLFGRDGDLRRAAEALSSWSIVTLIGPGGIGKTRLALALIERERERLAHSGPGRDGPCGVCLVELAAISTADDVARAVADAVRPSVHLIGTRQGLVGSIVSAIGSGSLLLVLDGCEHVVVGVAELVAALMARCPGVRVLATSQEGLGVAGERLLPVGPLDPPGAGVELFNRRAGAGPHGLDPDRSRQVAQICDRLDGVPLAIELVAACAGRMPLDVAARQLDDRLRLLANGRRTGLERRRTVAATIEWSHDLLTGGERLLLRRLSIFTGPFDAAAATAVAADRGADRVGGMDGASGVDRVDECLAGLAGRALVAADPDPSRRRFLLPEPVRSFAAEQLSAAGETDLVASRHAQWCVAETAAIGQLLAGRGEPAGVARLDRLWPELRAAFDFTRSMADPVLADRLIRPVATELQLRARSEIGDWAEQMLASIPPGHADLAGYWLCIAADRHRLDGDRAAGEHLVAGLRTTDHPLSRYAVAATGGDSGALVVRSAEAIDWLHQRRQNLLAEVIALTALAPALLDLGRCAEHDALLRPLVDRAAPPPAGSPPTCVAWAASSLSRSSRLAGDGRQAARWHRSVAGIDLPPGTRPIDDRPVVPAGRP
jgi:predicted ATPase